MIDRENIASGFASRGGATGRLQKSIHRAKNLGDGLDRQFSEVIAIIAKAWTRIMQSRR